MKSRISLATLLGAMMVTTPVAVPQGTLTDFLTDGLDAATAAAAAATGNGNNGNGNGNSGNGNSGNGNNGNGNNGNGNSNGGNSGKGKTFTDSEDDVGFLEAVTANSAAAAGVTGDYQDYSERLSKTLARLTPAQQAKIFK